MCTVLLPPGVKPIEVNKYIIYHIIYHFVSYHIIYHIVSYTITYIISYHTIYHIVSYHTISYIISYHTISYIISYRIISYIISYHTIYIISCSIVSYHISYHKPRQTAVGVADERWVRFILSTWLPLYKQPRLAFGFPPSDHWSGGTSTFRVEQIPSWFLSTIYNHPLTCQWALLMQLAVHGYSNQETN